jgi:hypothetical protein
MMYRATQEFMRIEAIGPRTEVNADPADPIWLHVRVTPADDLTTEIESALMQGAPPNGVVVTDATKFPYRLATGLWAFDLNPILYEVGKAYTIHWRHSTQPQVMAVTRSNFVWQPLPQLPRLPGYCVLHGVLTRVGGVPVPGARIIIEEYKDFVTLTHRLGSLTVSTDAFGAWWVEVPHKSVQRIIFGENIRTVVVPELSRAALKDVKEYQPDEDVYKDSFGYPMPGGPHVKKPRKQQLEVEAPEGGTIIIPPPPAPRSFDFHQSTPAAAWIIHHELPGKPSVDIVDVSGESVIGDIAYPNDGLIVVTFLLPVAGTAHLT